MVKLYFNRINQLADPLALSGSKCKLFLKLVCERQTLLWGNRAVVLVVTILMKHKEETCTLGSAVATDLCAEAVLIRR